MMGVHTPLDYSLGTEKAQTRAERRRQEKAQAKKKAIYTMTAEQLEAYKKEAAKQAAEAAEQQVKEIKTTMLNTAISCIESSLCIVLNDELGYGKKRLQRIIDKLEQQLDCIMSGNVTLEELETEKERLLKENKYQVEHMPDDIKQKMEEKIKKNK